MAEAAMLAFREGAEDRIVRAAARMQPTPAGIRITTSDQEVMARQVIVAAGPWISGGVEFNWPQHHRPGTFMPTDWAIERGSDGSVTAWMSEHDPLNRLKGMHGVRLKPDSSLVELRVRLFNRTPYLQTFLWWANAAVKVHDEYQSFFPPDVYYVADHAKRAISSFPIASNTYYGVDYQNRPGANNSGDSYLGDTFVSAIR